MIEVHRREIDRTVSDAEDDLLCGGGRSLLAYLINAQADIREMRWDPTREWHSPLVIYDFWTLVRAVERRQPSHEHQISNGRRVLKGIFDRGTLEFLETLHRK